MKQFFAGSILGVSGNDVIVNLVSGDEASETSPETTPEPETTPTTPTTPTFIPRPDRVLFEVESALSRLKKLLVSVSESSTDVAPESGNDLVPAKSPTDAQQVTILAQRLGQVHNISLEAIF